MSDQSKDFLDGDMSKSRIFKEITTQMAIGGGVAAAVVVGAGVLIWILYLIGTLLPEESKEADDPTPDSLSSCYSQPFETTRTG